MKLVSDQRLSALELTKAKLSDAEEALKHKVRVVGMFLTVHVDFMLKWKCSYVLQEFIFAPLGYLSLYLFSFFFLTSNVLFLFIKGYSFSRTQKTVRRTEIDKQRIRWGNCLWVMIRVQSEDVPRVVSRLQVVMALTRMCLIYRWAFLCLPAHDYWWRGSC